MTLDNDRIHTAMPSLHRLFVIAICGTFLGVGCDDDVATSPAPAHLVPTTPTSTASGTPEPRQVESGHISKALDHLLAPLPKPVRILSITALPSLVVLQVQNHANQAEVNQYGYRDGEVEGPENVKLLGKGSLKENLFRLRTADPRVAEEVLDKVRKQHQHPITKLVMVRNLPESRDIQFRVYVDSPAGELVIAADKHGRILGPIEVAPTASP